MVHLTSVPLKVICCITTMKITVFASSLPSCLQNYAGPDRPTVDSIFRVMYSSDDPDFVVPANVENDA